MHEKRNKTAPKPVETYTNPTSFTLSYTQTYTRKCLCLLVLSPCGVGNVGFFTKLFFEECVRSGSAGTQDFLCTDVITDVTCKELL